MRKNQLDEQGYQDGYWEHLGKQYNFKGYYQSGDPISYWEWVAHYETSGEILKHFYII